MKKISILFILILFVPSCWRWVIQSDPPFRSVNKDLYSITLTPSRQDRYRYKAFDLVIENRTTENIELVWDKTLYISDGQTAGGFMAEGVLYGTLYKVSYGKNNELKQSDIIFPKIQYKKTIYPNILTSYHEYWYHNTMPNGEVGIYITLKVNGKEMHEKLLVTIFAGYP